MPTLESKLVIGAKDETGSAFNAIQKHIGALDRQISVFDKLMASTRKVAGSSDQMIQSIDRGAKALMEERAALEGLARSMTSGVASAEEMAAVQGRLAHEVSKANRAMLLQGEEATRASGKIKRARESMPKGGMLGTATGGMIALGGMELAVKTAEASGNLEQAKFRVRAVSQGDKTESPFAEALAEEIAQKYPNITQQRALDTYVELRGNAANQNGSVNQETARRNLMTVAQAQTASLAIGTELTPEDAQNLLKAVEGSGRAGDPTAVGKMFDSYIRAKQVFGSAIDSSKIRDYVQNAKGANFGIGEEQFFWQNIVRMTEGNASRLGNETSQTLQTLVGGHATKQTAKWLVDMGLATGFTPQGGGAATIHGLSGSGTLQVNQLDWANKYLLPALEKHGVLSEENIAKREALLKKDNPNIDARALRERAEQGLISSAVARSGMRTTVTDNLAHAIANELLINRDVAQMKGASGSADLAARVGQNPVAALAQFTGALTDFAATLGGPLMPAATAGLEKLGNAVKFAEKQLADFDKAHPSLAPAANAGVIGGGVAALGWAGWKSVTGAGRGIMRALGLGGGGAAAGGAADAAAGGGLSGVVSTLMGFGNLPGLINLLTDDNRTAKAKANDAAAMAWGKSLLFGPSAGAPMQLPGATPASPVGAPFGLYRPATLGPGRDVHSPSTGPYAYYPPSQAVSISGEARVDQELVVRIEASPLLQAIVDQARQQSETTVPLSGGGSGRMDSDAGPHRGPGVGHM
jgi:hypothetical protein